MLRLVDSRRTVLSLLCLLAWLSSFAVSLADAPHGAGVARINYADDVAPLLRRHCYRCHGSKNQEANLQLNQRSRALSTADSDQPIIVPGDPDASLLIARITDDAAGEVMPPDAPALSDAEVAVLRQWIAQDAPWPDEFAGTSHWAYSPIKRPQPPLDAQIVRQQLPAATSPTAIVNPIDTFVAAKLAARGLSSNPPLEGARLLRRASLALTGLPPSPDQVQEFVSDTSADAYERAVDQLLESPAYGERWALPWLDLARYADSNGFQADQIRDNWAYRDWVIRSFNADKPFNEFVIDQLAGDLRPGASVDQRIATGFHRMTTCNVEAGVHPEANRVNQIVDRVNTTATVFLGTTLECCQCHDHKYDPFTQRDYYRLFAFFNNTPLEVKNTAGVTWDFYGPKMDLPLDPQMASVREPLLRQAEQIREQMASARQSIAGDFPQWLASIRAEQPQLKSRWKNAIPEFFEAIAGTSDAERGQDFKIQSDGAVLLTGAVPSTVDYVFTFALPDEAITAIRIDLLTDDAIPGKGPGRGDRQRSNVVLNEFVCHLVDDKERIPLSLQAPRADFSQTGWDVGGAIDGDLKTGWAVAPQFGKPHWAEFAFAQPVLRGDGHRRLQVTMRQLFGSGRVAGKPRIRFFTGNPSLRLLSEEVVKLASIDDEKRTDKQTQELQRAFELGNHELQSLSAELKQCEKRLAEYKPETTLVMAETEPRETFLMVRGDYEQLGEKTPPGTPEVLPVDLDVPATGDRLQLARWLTSPRNPLLARVTVNRWWAEFFGRGIVETLEDFGTQAESPTHPRLLDWLASELIDSGWSMKHVHKQIVMSATFRQQSRFTAELLESDPQNQWLARGPSFRLPAELVRDNALAISGLLSPKMYGPPIMPFQPDDLWRSVGRNQPRWVAAQNEDRFRRGLYVIWKRAAPYPSFVTLDAPDRSSCTVARKRTNTPLQALALLNDPAFAEMAIAFADRVLTNTNVRLDADRIAYAFKLATSRQPTDQETKVLLGLLDRQRAQVASNKDSAGNTDNASNTDNAALRIESLLSITKPKCDDNQELAAWFAITNAILNLDETISF